jgi:predicted  nucleic acid-binding Zn-ribbon protein
MTDFPEFSHVREVLRKVQDRLTAIEAEVRYLRERSAEVEGKIGTIEGRLNAIDQRIDWGHEHLGALGVR